MGTDSGLAVRYVRSSGCIFAIVLPACLITLKEFRWNLADLPGLQEAEAAATKGWLQRVKFVMGGSRSALTNRRPWMNYPTIYT